MEHDHMVQALPPSGTNHPLNLGSLPGGARCTQHFVDAHASHLFSDVIAAERPKASIMVHARKPGTERGVTTAGKVEVFSGERSAEINLRIHSRYMSLAAISDPQIGPVFASFDDVTLGLTPDSWFSWDLSALDEQAFGGRLGGTPGYLLPLA